VRFVIITVVFLIPVVALHAESEAFLNFDNSEVLETCEEAASREAEIHAQAVAPLIRQARSLILSRIEPVLDRIASEKMPKLILSEDFINRLTQNVARSIPAKVD
jgi:hypothetical protein